MFKQTLNAFKKMPYTANLAVNFVTGALLTLAFAPFDIWVMSLVAPMVLLYSTLQLTNKRAFYAFFAFGSGLFLSGTSWVYIAIHDFGMTAAPLAGIMTAIFVFGLGALFAATFIPYFFIRSQNRVANGLTFIAIWVLGEWFRSWFLTGFPWLYLGYSHTDTLLAGWGPLLGVFGLSTLALLSGLLLSFTLYRRANITQRLYPLLGITVIWAAGLTLTQFDFSKIDRTSPKSVALIQPNIPLHQKWDPRYRETILTTLTSLSEPHWDKQIMVWPEAAIPMLHSDAMDFLEPLSAQAHLSDTALVTGLLYDEYAPTRYYNGIISLGQGDGLYFKQRLVPFGEYVPLESWLRGIIHFFDLPQSIIHKGPKQQGSLHAHDIRLAPFICYEIVYPALVAHQAKNQNVLITISNDAWFGRSIGPKQHFQMARMRAIETQRYLIRGTNTGISSLINAQGKVELMAPSFVATSVSGTVYPATASTPYMIWGNLPILLFTFTIMGLGIYRHQTQNSKPD